MSHGVSLLLVELGSENDSCLIPVIPSPFHTGFSHVAHTSLKVHAHAARELLRRAQPAAEAVGDVLLVKNVLTGHEDLHMLVHAEGAEDVKDPMGVLDGLVRDVLEALARRNAPGD